MTSCPGCCRVHEILRFPLNSLLRATYLAYSFQDRSAFVCLIQCMNWCMNVFAVLPMPESPCDCFIAQQSTSPEDLLTPRVLPE